METNQFVMATVGIVVVFLVIITAAIPIIGGFTESSPGETAENSAVSDITTSLYTVNDGTTFSITMDELNKLYVNGAIYGEYSFVLFDDYVLPISSSITSLFIPEQTTAAIIREMSLTVNDSGITGTITTVSPTSTISINSTDPVYLALDHEYNDVAPEWATPIDDMVLVSTDSSTIDAYVNSDSDIITLRLDGYITGFWTGTYDDLVPHGSVGNSSPAFTAENNDGVVHLTGVSGAGDGSMGDTLLNIFVPKTYYSILPVEPQVSGPVADMVNLVPLLLVVGLIIAAVAAFITLKSRGGGA